MVLDSRQPSVLLPVPHSILPLLLPSVLPFLQHVLHPWLPAAMQPHLMMMPLQPCAALWPSTPSPLHIADLLQQIQLGNICIYLLQNLQISRNTMKVCTGGY